MSHLRHIGASSWTNFGLFARTWVDLVASKVILNNQVRIKPAWISKWASSYASLTPSVGWTSKWLGWSDQLLGLLVLLGPTNCYLLHRRKQLLLAFCRRTIRICWATSWNKCKLFCLKIKVWKLHRLVYRGYTLYVEKVGLTKWHNRGRRIILHIDYSER